MGFSINAACGCSVGKVRRNNEDNFYFAGQSMERENRGLEGILSMSSTLEKSLFFGVFDGMGGERFGEYAAYAAAEALSGFEDMRREQGGTPVSLMEHIAEQTNLAVVRAQREMRTEHMGTTLVGLYINEEEALHCNIGDSRAYLYRQGMLYQISEDHTQTLFPGMTKKPSLIQYLGLDPEEIELEPCITRHELQTGDQYLLCSDGLTDMLSDQEITDRLATLETVEQKVQALMQAALDRGGKDNLTVILCVIA